MNILNKIKDRFNGGKFTFTEKIIYAVTLIFFITNFKYISYPDEFVNLLAGLAINQGKLPYVHFFDHHLPFAWYLAAIFLAFSFKSFVLFRFYYAIFMFASLSLLAVFIRRHFRDFYKYYLGFFVFYPLISVYFWIHIYIADSLAVLFFSLIFWLLAIQTLSQKIIYKAMVAASLLTFAMIFSSLTFLYLGLALYLWQLFLLWPDRKKVFRLVLWIVAPYLIYFIFLLITQSFKDFYFSNFTYNTEHYISIPNYVRGRFFNPLKFALTLIFNFHTNYLPLLTKIKHLDLYLPIGVLAGMGSLTLLILFLSRNLVLGLIFFLVLSFSAPRSNIQTVNETDYQAAMFVVLGTISTFIALYLLKRLRLSEQFLADLKRVIYSILAILLFFSFIFLLANTYNKYFLRYTQIMPSINNYSATALFLDEILNEDDVFWVGPYEPHEAFFVKAKLIGKYPTLLPQFKENEHLKSGFLEEFEKNPPKIVIFRHEASVFNTPSEKFGDFFLSWMSDKYTQIEKIEGIKILKSPSSFNLRTDLYLRNDYRDSLLETLRAKGYIEQ